MPIGLAARTARSPVEVRVEPAPTEAVVTYFDDDDPGRPRDLRVALAAGGGDAPDGDGVLERVVAS